MSAARRPRRSGGPARPDNQWDAHPVLGAAVRLSALLVPVVVAVLTAVVLARVLPAADGMLPRLAWWLAVLGGSTVALLLTDRLARRLLPLAILLELSLVFPDRAPSRLRAARTVSVREMEQRLNRLRSAGVQSRPIEAAETLVTLVSILGLHDSRTRGHSERVRALTDLLSAELDLPEEDRIRLRWAALVHDLGKLTVPTEVLNGGRDLTDDQWAGLRRHPEEGVRLVSGLLPWLGDWGRAVGEHHERWDGTGYPKGLAGEDIGYAARIVAVADSFETMTAARSYSKAMSADQAREELTRCAGSQFDPAVVRAFLGVSVGRLRWVLGPLTWLAEVPFVATADRAGQAVKAGAIGVVIGGLVTLGLAPGPDEGEIAIDSAAPAPSLTELRESAGSAPEGGAGTGSGSGLGSGTASEPSSALAPAGLGASGQLGGAGASPFGAGQLGAGQLGLGFGGAQSPGAGYGGGRGAGDGGPDEPATPGTTPGTTVRTIGPRPVFGPPQPPVTGATSDDGTQAATGDGGVDAQAPAPQVPAPQAPAPQAPAPQAPAPQPGAPQPPAPQQPAPAAPRPADGAGDDGGDADEGDDRDDEGKGGRGEGAQPAQPADPGGPGEPAEPAQPAQPPNRDDDDSDDESDDGGQGRGRDDVAEVDAGPAATDVQGPAREKRDKEGKHGDKHDGKHPGKDTDHDSDAGGAFGELPGVPPAAPLVLGVLAGAALAAGAVRGGARLRRPLGWSAA